MRKPGNVIHFIQRSGYVTTQIVPLDIGRAGDGAESEEVAIVNGSDKQCFRRPLITGPPNSSGCAVFMVGSLFPLILIPPDVRRLQWPHIGADNPV